MVKHNYYFYYLFLINALINIINFVPRGLINERFSGAIMAILASIPIGVAFTFMLVKLMSKFPGEDLPQIFNANFKRSIASFLLILHGLLWYSAGLVTLLSFVDVTLRYISSDVQPFFIMLGFLVLVGLCIRATAESILYGLEVLIILNVPIIIYVLAKALLNPSFSWDAVMQIITYSWEAPSFQGIATGTFIFSGYLNLVIFNKAFKAIKVRHYWFLGLSGLVVLLITFLVPVGMHGTMGVTRHVYPWFSTADVLRTKNFIVERVLFMFYFTYLSLALISCIVHWHCAMVFFKGALPAMRTGKSRFRLEMVLLVLFAVGALYAQNLDQYSMDRIGLWFMDIRFCAEAILITCVFTAYRLFRRRRPRAS
ncbi:GerAB/ArcD/ProY family transporter [Paenibacillus sp. JX-17]|uniref:GerAB/ArcD/ProY family transporter n=1 Tax=Paenibacillus lacisoli TaxID=3064525 RepID=A0ABT9C9Z0_9BACL|nr:GerAB/ArcD/ProY family transporter [Paenibacillus sp. JX-17]MDO7906061.1 GerAB/ArcD/ProY family transporter [Paenibacillus sp. JX-17]